MKESKSKQTADGLPCFSYPADIRRQAEQQVKAREKTLPADTLLSHERVVHELQVHQIELEMQNEELRRSHLDLETARAKFVSLYDLAPIGYLTISEQGLIQEGNLTAAELLGVDRRALTHRPLSLFILNQDQEIFYLHRKKLQETGVRQVCEFRMLRNGAGSFWVRMEAIAADGDDGASVLRVALSDITCSKKAEEALLHSSKELKTKSAELERFLYTVSHDLKSPVITIQSFIRCLEQDMAAADSSSIEKDVKFIKSAADKMGHQLDELLEMSRVGRLIGVSSHIAVQDIVNDVVNTVAGRISDRGVTVVVADMDVELYGDRPRLAELWQNLIENACKFMGDQKNPRIDIGMEQRDKETVFTVKDNGIGIESKHHDRVFGQFEQLDKKIEGSGMGLPIVKRIVELYQGRIWVESAGSGQGTTFCFTLPGAVKTEGGTV